MNIKILFAVAAIVFGLIYFSLRIYFEFKQWSLSSKKWKEMNVPSPKNLIEAANQTASFTGIESDMNLGRTSMPTNLALLSAGLSTFAFLIGLLFLSWRYYLSGAVSVSSLLVIVVLFILLLVSILVLRKNRKAKL